MSRKDITQIRVDKATVGIMGLKEVMEEMAPTWAHRTDKEIMEEFLTRLSKRNYIPPSAGESYGRAFLKAFKRHLGQSQEEGFSDALVIKVLGPGCSQCDKLEQDVMDVLSEIDLPADLEHVRDIKEIGSYGVMGTPALLINGKVMCVGRVPPKVKIKEWLAAYK